VAGGLDPLGVVSPADGAGLSEAHISPLPWVEWHAGAGLFTLRTGRQSLTRLPGKGGKREKITQMSNQSRQRLRLLLASLVLHALPLFATLTYPASFPLDAGTFKNHLDGFGKRFRRKYPLGSFVWKLEFQKRGAPHFHLFVFGVGDLRSFRHWVEDAWPEVVKSGDPKHNLAGTSVEQIRSRAGAMSYCSGYASKTDQTRPGEEFGRYWGVVGRERLPKGERQVLELEPVVAIQVERTARRFIKAMNRKRRLRVIGTVLKQSWGQAANLLQQQSAGRLLEYHGRKLPRKNRVRNSPTLNVFCDADQWQRYILWQCSNTKRAIASNSPTEALNVKASGSRRETE
jgi:hypothetical protein